MKKVITLVFLAVMLCLSAQAQSHLTFLGIPIDGDVYKFCEKLKEKGFRDNTMTQRYEEDAVFYGDILGKEPYVTVYCNQKTKKVSTIWLMVSFDNSSKCKTYVSAMLKRLKEIHPTGQIRKGSENERCNFVFEVREKSFWYDFFGGFFPSSWFPTLGTIVFDYEENSAETCLLSVYFNDTTNNIDQ